MIELGFTDISVIVVYLALTVFIGFWVSRLGHAGLRGYFLGGNKVSWRLLGLSNASGMFDVAGTMWMVYLLYVYGLKSIWIPWLWPIFNQIFNMVYLSAWLRRSNRLTGAEWITFRFGDGFGARSSHLIVVVFALFNVVGFLAYGFVGIGKFIVVFFPYNLVEIYNLSFFLPDQAQLLSLDDPARIAMVNDLNARIYGLIFVLITSAYVIKGGLKSVVFTELLQFFVMTAACLGVAYVAMTATTAAQIQASTPDGWSSVWFGWELGLDWGAINEAVNRKIESDQWDMFGVFMMLVVFKGLLQSFAGLPPNYDMQRVLATKSPVEAAKMSGMISFVLLPTRYLLITGLTVLALVYLGPDLEAMGDNIDFEQILPLSMAKFMPAVLLGILIAGLTSAFMSTFASTLNAAPVYIVNDIYKKYFRSNGTDRHYVAASYLVSVAIVVISIGLGMLVPSVNAAILWVVSALYGGYAAANVLKWYWWRFNGIGFTAGMAAGLIAASILPFTGLSPLTAFPLIFMFCLFVSVSGALLTEPTEMRVLCDFYRQTRPWGFWGPVHRALEELEGGDVPRNNQFLSNMRSIVVGVVWQTAITALPIFFVIKAWGSFGVTLTIVFVCSIYLKVYWWDRLEENFGSGSRAQVAS